MSRMSNNFAINRLVSSSAANSLPFKLEKEVNFDATTGTVDVHKIAEVTGLVAIQVVATCSTNLVGSTATIKLGTDRDDDGILTVQTATDLDKDDFWYGSTISAAVPALSDVLNSKLVGSDISYKIETAAITDGTIKFYLLWSPLTENANVWLV